MPTEEDLLASAHVVRPILDQIANKWSIMILIFLCEKPQRFNAIRRRLGGITQKALTEALRRLERHGLILRTVVPVSPISVVYSITPLGRELQAPFLALYTWAVEHGPAMREAEKAYAESAQALPPVEDV